MFKAQLLALMLMWAIFAPLIARAQIALSGPESTSLRPTDEVTGLHVSLAAMQRDEVSQWSWGFETLYTFHQFPNPWYLAAGSFHKNPRHYHLATQLASLRHQVTTNAGPGLLRGNLELTATMVGTVVVSGPESYFIGAAFGGRYNFVQPGARLIPFVELRGGAGACDSQGLYQSIQTDLTFTYLIGVGLRFDLNPRSSLTFSVTDQHLSNAWFANPDYGFDSLGATLGVQTHF